MTFFMPALEGPKNLLWMAFCLVWVINRTKTGHWGGRWDGWDTVIALWIGSAYAAAFFSGIKFKEWNGANDLLRYGSILWLMKRSDYGKTEVIVLFAAGLAGLMPAIGYGFWRAYIAKKRTFLELHSVGHVNHTSVYLAIAAGAALTTLVASWQSMRANLRILLAIALLTTAGALALTSSRAAMGGFAAFLIGITIIWRSKAMAGAIILALALGITAEFVPGTYGVITKLRQNVAAKEIASFRDKIWALGLQGTKQFPFFGVGMDNFQRITIDQACKWHEARTESCPKTEYGQAPHAHSLYVNTLAERGWVGFLVLMGVFAAWARMLWRDRATPSPFARSLWGASFAALTVNMVGGLLNTTLHHEIAILSVMILALHIALSKQSTAPAAQP
jgi:O-antigen ligase